MKDLGLILDLNQPLIYEESVVKKLILDFYNPLIRVLKSYKNFNFSINIPLNTLEILDKHGGSSFISDLKELYQNERVEIVNSSPYGLSLFGLSKNIVESQMMLNEYGLGYFLGSTKGFEGEPSIMLRDALGFFPANYSVDDTAIKVLSDFGYSWFAVKDMGMKKGIVEISLKDSNLRAVGVFDDLNYLIYPQKNLVDADSSGKEAVVYDDDDKRNMSVRIEAILKKHVEAGCENIVFEIGNPSFIPENNSDYKDIINNIESVFDSLSQSNYLVKSVGELVKSKNKVESVELPEFCKSMSKVKIESNGKKTVNINIEKNVIKFIDDKLSLILNSDKKYESTVIKMWNIEEIKTLNDIQLRNNMSFLLFISKVLPLIEIKHSNMNKKDSVNLNSESDFNQQYDFYVSELLSYIEEPEIIDFFKNLV